MTTTEAVARCAWAGGDALLEAYHDVEWGTPLHDDRALFELLTLEGAQAGLSWLTVLRRRDGYRRAFAEFDIERIAAFDEADVVRLMADSGIIRNRAKIVSTIGNARAVQRARQEYGSLDALAWSFVDGRPRLNQIRTPSDLPAQTPESVRMSKTLRQRGLGFVGPTICYAFMQAAGLVNDHELTCARHAQLLHIMPEGVQ